MKKKPSYEVGSGNVFADIGLPNPEEHLVKAHLVLKIDRLMKLRGLKQVEAAKLFGVKQPDVSKLMAGKSGRHRREMARARSFTSRSRSTIPPPRPSSNSSRGCENKKTTHD